MASPSKVKAAARQKRYRERMFAAGWNRAMIWVRPERMPELQAILQEWARLDPPAPGPDDPDQQDLFEGGER